MLKPHGNSTWHGGIGSKPYLGRVMRSFGNSKYQGLAANPILQDPPGDEVTRQLQVEEV
jgi:hypothetical protein